MGIHNTCLKHTNKNTHKYTETCGVTYSAVRAGNHGITHPGAKARARSSHCDWAANCCQATTTYSQRHIIKSDIQAKESRGLFERASSSGGRL